MYTTIRSCEGARFPVDSLSPSKCGCRPIVFFCGALNARAIQALYGLVPMGYTQQAQLARGAAMHPMSLRTSLAAMSEDFVGKWTNEADKRAPSDFASLAAFGVHETGVPICYPSVRHLLRKPRRSPLQLPRCALPPPLQKPSTQHSQPNCRLSRTSLGACSRHIRCRS